MLAATLLAAGKQARAPGGGSTRSSTRAAWSAWSRARRRRLNVSNVSEGSCRAKLELVDAQGAVVASKTATIAADASASLRFQPSGRIQVRPRVISIMQSCSKNEVSVETIELTSGKTVAILAGEPIG